MVHGILVRYNNMLQSLMVRRMFYTQLQIAPLLSASSPFLLTLTALSDTAKQTLFNSLTAFAMKLQHSGNIIQYSIHTVECIAVRFSHYWYSPECQCEQHLNRTLIDKCLSFHCCDTVRWMYRIDVSADFTAECTCTNMHIRIYMTNPC